MGRGESREAKRVTRRNSLSSFHERLKEIYHAFQKSDAERDAEVAALVKTRLEQIQREGQSITPTDRDEEVILEDLSARVMSARSICDLIQEKGEGSSLEAARLLILAEERLASMQNPTLRYLGKQLREVVIPKHKQLIESALSELPDVHVSCLEVGEMVGEDMKCQVAFWRDEWEAFERIEAQGVFERTAEEVGHKALLSFSPRETLAWIRDPVIIHTVLHEIIHVYSLNKIDREEKKTSDHFSALLAEGFVDKAADRVGDQLGEVRRDSEYYAAHKAAASEMEKLWRELQLPGELEEIVLTCSPYETWDAMVSASGKEVHPENLKREMMQVYMAVEDAAMMSGEDNRYLGDAVEEVLRERVRSAFTNLFS